MTRSLWICRDGEPLADVLRKVREASNAVRKARCADETLDAVSDLAETLEQAYDKWDEIDAETGHKKVTYAPYDQESENS